MSAGTQALNCNSPRLSDRLAYRQAGCGDHGRRREPLIPRDLDFHYRALRKGGGRQHERNSHFETAHDLILSQG